MGTIMRAITLAAALLVCACSSRSPTSLGATKAERAAEYESEVRHAFFVASGREPRDSRELLRYMDQRSIELPKLDETSIDELVQAYGATLGQLLIADLGGKWVTQSVDGEQIDGVALPNGKVAFVFNRAWRRIAEKDPIGFEVYFESAADLVSANADVSGDLTVRAQ